MWKGCELKINPIVKFIIYDEKKQPFLQSPVFKWKYLSIIRDMIVYKDQHPESKKPTLIIIFII